MAEPPCDSLSSEDLTADDKLLTNTAAALPASPFVFSVTELTKAINGIMRANFSSIWVKGEISAVTQSTQGHVFLSLKDEQALLAVIIFQSTLAAQPYLRSQLIQGQVIECLGELTFYKKRGSCQLIATEIRQVGIGQLHLAYLAQREKFIAAGLFDPERKRSIPLHTFSIGLITSLQGAVVADIIRTLASTPSFYGGFELILYDTLVQGQAAPVSIAKQIKAAQKAAKVDVLILARGGGSLEELAVFNDADVVEALAACSIATISAIGHANNQVCTDEAADYHAATPTAAATFLIENRKQYVDALANLRTQANKLICDKLTRIKETLQQHTPIHLQKLLHMQLNTLTHKLAFLENRAYYSLHTLFTNKQTSLKSLQHMLSSLDPKNVLQRGYVALEKDKKWVSQASVLKKHDQVVLTFHDGTHSAQIT